MTVMILCVWFFAFAWANSPYLIVDPAFTVPSCTVGKTTLSNVLGQLSIDYDLLGRTLSFSVQFPTTPIYPCAMCQIDTNYCNTTPVRPGNLRLNTDYASNAFILAIPSGTPFPRNIDAEPYQFQLNQPGPTTLQKNSLMWQQRPVDCSQSIALVIQPILSVEQPLTHDIFAMVSEMDQEHSLPCTNNSQRIFDLFQCRALGNRTLFITLEMANCVAMRQSIPPGSPNGFGVSPVARTSLDWYYRAISNQLPLGLGLDNLTLCGQNWLQLLKMSQMTYYCSRKAPLYLLPKAWYQLALEVIAARLNLAIAVYPVPRLALEESLDALESACLERDTLLAPINATHLYPLYLQLVEFNGVMDDRSRVSLCKQILLSLDTVLSEAERVFLPVYMQFYNEWFFYPFNYLVLYSNGHMRTGVIAFLTFFALVGLFIVLVAMVFPVWRYIARKVEEYYSAEEGTIHSHRYKAL